MTESSKVEHPLWSVEMEVFGLVQGVFYRATAASVAKRIGLVGYVENRLNGTVFTVAEGTRDQLNEYKEWCRTGPRMANVTAVEEVKKMTQVEKLSFDNFSIREESEATKRTHNAEQL